MAYTNSKLVNYTLRSPNYSAGRICINRIAIHCVVGQVTVERLGQIFANPNRQASSNYGVGLDGKIGLYVDEKNRSWCTSSAWCDNRAITIEVASDNFHPYAVTDKAYNATIKLVVDICKRNGKKKVTWISDKNKNLAYNPADDEILLTAHRFYAAKACVPVNTEVLTPTGWKRIGDVEIGDTIACATLDGLNVVFDKVFDVVEPYEADTYTSNGLTATKDHRLVYRGQYQSEWRIDHCKNLLRKADAYIPCAGKTNYEGLDITDDMLRFLIAVQADGHYMYDRTVSGDKSYCGVEFHLKKQRKIDRIKEILGALSIEFKETYQSDGSTKIRVYNNDIIKPVDLCEKYLQNKMFTWDWLKLSPEQADIFFDEIQLWDGCKAAKLYTSAEKQNVDIVSAIAATHNVGSNVTGSNVLFRENPYICLGEEKRNKKAPVTCVSVPTGIFIARQNGKTFVIGNCPGDYLFTRFADIAKKANAELSKSASKTTASKPKTQASAPKTTTSTTASTGKTSSTKTTSSKKAVSMVATRFDARFNKLFYVTAKDGLHLRQGCGTSTKSLKVLKYGTPVRCYGYYTPDDAGYKWMYVVADGKTGFVCSLYVNI